MFGTFEAERSDVKLVYGLVDQPQFWNPVQHQVRMVSYTFSICFVKMKQLPPQPPLPSHEKRGHVVGFVFPFHAPDQHHCHHQHQKASALSSITVSINTEQHQHQRASALNSISTMISITLFTIVSMSSISCGAGLSFGVAIPSPSSRV